MHSTTLASHEVFELHELLTFKTLCASNKAREYCRAYFLINA